MLSFITKEERSADPSILEVRHSRKQVFRNVRDVLYFVPQKGMEQLVRHDSVGKNCYSSSVGSIPTTSTNFNENGGVVQW